jgi:hypothetical protein
MGAIFPMASLKARQGFVRRRERAKRAAEALKQTSRELVNNPPTRVPRVASEEREP